MTVRTRFAPSPTGYLHIGGVRTALFNWLFARKNGGQFLLRIDDTDANRNLDEALQPILDGFKWLGIDWDEGPEVDGPHAPYFQSQRNEKYQAAVDRLIEVGAAYRDYSDAETEYGAERKAAEESKTSFVYSRKWMAETDEQAKAFEAEGRSYVVRLKMHREGTCEFRDLVRGDVSIRWDSENDHVIQRQDGSFIYHLANVVDDHDFEITHVIRAIEHLTNTPRQIFIAESLGYKIPQHAHIPYVADPKARKISKRKLSDYLRDREFQKLQTHAESIAKRMDREVNQDLFNPVIVDFYRDVGYLPSAILNYLVLLGWSLDDKTEDFSVEEMIANFGLDRVVKAPAKFDAQKLTAFQKRKMEALPIKQKTAMVLPFLQSAGLVSDPPPCEIAEIIGNILKGAGDRITVAGDILDYAEFFSEEIAEYEEKAFNKRILKPENAIELLQKFVPVLSSFEPFEAASIETQFKSWLEAEDIKIGQIIHAIRVGVTGKGVGFGMFETLEYLGKERCVARIQQTIQRAQAEKE